MYVAIINYEIKSVISMNLKDITSEEDVTSFINDNFDIDKIDWICDKNPIIHDEFINVNGKAVLVEESEQIKAMKEIFDNCISTFKAKNNDYDDSFTDAMNLIGPATVVSRLYDKVRRLISLLVKKKEQKVLDEKPKDTFLDLIVYSAMALAYYRKNKDEIKEVDFINDKK